MHRLGYGQNQQHLKVVASSSWLAGKHAAQASGHTLTLWQAGTLLLAMLLLADTKKPEAETAAGA